VRLEGGGSAAQFTVADNGTLAYLQDNFSRQGLVWLDRDGARDLVGAPRRAYRYPRLSPDGRRVAIEIRDQLPDIWTWDFARRALMRQTTDSSIDQTPAWMPDGRRLVFSSAREQTQAPFWQAADGTGSAERLGTDVGTFNHPSPSPDGQHLVLRAGTAEIGFDLVMLSFERSRRIAPLLRSPFNELNGEISPDGRWMAYQSDESGIFEVYVRPFPHVNGGRWQVSSGGGTKPMWVRAGRELLYLAPDGMLMATPVNPETDFSVGRATRLVDLSEYEIGGFSRNFDTTPDGNRFLLLQTDDDRSQINVVLNWFEDLKAKAPTE
jgi:serine/threonine-protein kinase